MKKMSILGIGPKLALLTIMYAIPVIIIDSRSFIFKINLPSIALHIVSAVLLLIGIPFLLISAVTLRKAYKLDILYTKGAYSICRHPLYSSWLFFIIPGLLLFLQSWLVMTIFIFMYLFFRILIKREEIYLAQRFGEEFENYQNTVPLVFPKLWKYSK
jgi:protein-S-isoprenylcysteine O-methyltransferase Ste14